MQTITLMIGDKTRHDVFKDVSPERILSFLEANRDVATIAICQCSCEQLLDFLLEMQRCTIDSYLISQTQKEGHDDTNKIRTAYRT